MIHFQKVVRHGNIDRRRFGYLWIMTVVKWSNYSWECINAWIWDDCCVFSDVDVIKLTLTETVALVQNRTRIGRILKAGKAIPECIAQAPEKGGQNERNVDYANIYSFMRFHTQEDALLHLYSARLFSELSCIKFIFSCVIWLCKCVLSRGQISPAPVRRHILELIISFCVYSTI